VIPADIIVATSHKKCFIQTSQLDGEKSLKVKFSATFPLEPGVMISTETPTTDLIRFSGLAELSNNQTFAIGIESFIPRGSVLKNSGWIIGLVVFTGIDTKMMMNAKSPRHTKIGALDR
jgi:magnesium-transporting ATPase (P-type)